MIRKEKRKYHAKRALAPTVDEQALSDEQTLSDEHGISVSRLKGTV